MRSRWMFWVVVSVAIVIAVGAVALWANSEEVPSGRPGPEADALARKIGKAVDLDAWARTGAVSFVFAGKHRLLWDRRRGLLQVQWGDERVLMNLADRTGRVFHAGLPIAGRRRELDQAYRYFINDVFWLNPAATFFNDDVSRELVEFERGPDGLLVRYGSGGVTPGDSYLIHVDDKGLPVLWQMWVKIIPVGGMRATWEGWITLSTGARVSTRHRVGPRTLILTEVAGARTLSELTGGDDPFTPLWTPQ